MAKVNTDTTLDFKEFPPVSTEEWERIIRKDLKGKNYKKALLWQTLEGIEALPFYRRENLDELAHTAETIQSNADWDIIEKIDIADVEKANKQALTALQNGATGLQFELPHTVIDSKNKLSALLDDIHLEMISIHFGEGLSTPEIYSWFVDLCSEHQINPDFVKATFSFGLMSGALRFGKLLKKDEIISLYKKLSSSHSTFSVNADICGNCGGTIVQQLAFALAEGNEYLVLSEDLGREFSEVAANIHFNFSTASNYFIEIAKFRAFRLVWRQVLDAYVNNLPDGSKAFIHAKTARWNKSTRDAHNNIIRATTEAMSAAIGGCDAITVERFDDTFADHSEFSARIARNIQLILKGESYLDKVSDAGAGSYYIEVLTDTLARESWKLFQDIEQHGGFYEAIKTGYIQEQLTSAQNEKIKAYQNQQAILVGVNKYKAEEAPKAAKENKKSEPENTSEDYHQVEKVPELTLEGNLNIGE